MQLIRRLGCLVGVALLGLGLVFLLAPDAALQATFHQSAQLPFVMGGRYAFFGVLLIGAVLYGDVKVLSFLLAGFAGLALFDTVLYLQTAPIPHFAVGALCAAASAVFFTNRKRSS